MPAKPDMFTFAAIGDLHVQEDRTSLFRELFAEISTKAEVLVLCGDLTDVGKPREAEILAEDLRACSIPVVGVLGNHDYECGQVEQVEKILKAAGIHLLNGQSYEANGVAFVGVKGFIGGFGRRMLASFGEGVVKSFVAESVGEAMRLENAMRTVRNERAVVVLHYAPVVDTVEGEPLEIFPFLGSSRLSETIDRFKVSAVVHGHAHHGRYQGRTPRGAPVYNVALQVEKPSGRPYALIKVLPPALRVLQRPLAKFLENAFAQNIGIALASFGKFDDALGDDFVGDGGTLGKTECDPCHFECDADDAPDFRVGSSIVEKGRAQCHLQEAFEWTRSFRRSSSQRHRHHDPARCDRPDSVVGIESTGRR
jgi:Icc-related predicted phosphoesterase